MLQGVYVAPLCREQCPDVTHISARTLLIDRKFVHLVMQMPSLLEASC